MTARRQSASSMSLANRPGGYSYSTTMSLTPLPQDPNNILPLSVPTTPLQTPGISPHPSMSDIKDYIGSWNPSGSSSSASASAGPSSNRSQSPRTSMSTSTDSSYDPGRSSDSRSSISGDEAAPILRRAGWWARTAQPRSTLRTAQSKMISLPPVSTSTTTTTSSTRSWGNWLMNLLPRPSNSTHTTKTKSGGRRFRIRRDTMREREKERYFDKVKRRDSVTGAYPIERRSWACLPSKPLAIVSRRVPYLPHGKT